jgi:hypothetical protein
VLLAFHIFAGMLLLDLIAFFLDAAFDYPCKVFQLIRYSVNFLTPNLGYCIVISW